MSFSTFFRKAHPQFNDVTIAFDTDFNPMLTLLYVGVDCDLELRLSGSSASKVYKAVPAGTWISLPISRIVAAGTTAAVADLIGHR